MGEEQHVAQTNRASTIVLGQRVLVELAERSGQSLLHLRGERLTPTGPVDGDELAQLIGTLDDARQRLGHQAAMRGVTRHLAHQQQRRVTQLHALASLDGQRGHLLGVHLRNQLMNAAGDLHAVLVELALPQHAGEDRAAQRLLGVMLRAGAPSCVRGRLQPISSFNFVTFKRAMFGLLSGTPSPVPGLAGTPRDTWLRASRRNLCRGMCDDG